MAEVLQLPVTSTGESAQELLLEQRDVLERVENVLERTYSRVELIQEIAALTLGVQEEQLSMFRRQLENQEFANEEARREAARMRAGGGIGPSGATAETADSGGGTGFGALPALATGAVAGGLAASGLRSTLGRLAGRLLRGGGLIAIGNIFGETIGNFLGTEAAAILEDLGADPEFANQVGSAIRSNSESAIVGAGISKLLLGRTLPGIIGGIIFNQLDLSRIFTEEGREELTQGISEWFERMRDGELTDEDIINGALVGGAAAYGARQVQRGGQAIGRRFPTFRPDGTVDGPGQAARPGPRPAPTPGTFVRPRRANGQFMSDAEITEMYEQEISNAKYKRVFRNVLKGLAFLGVALTAYEAYQLYQILNSNADEKAKQAAVGSFIGGFVGALGGGAGGAALGAYFGPWGILIGGALGAGLGGFAGGTVGEYIAAWAFEEEPPVYQTEEQYQSFLEQNRQRFEAGPNVGIIEGITGDNTGAIQRTTPSYAEQYGFSRSAPQAGTGATAIPAPLPEVTSEQKALIDQITSLTAELEGLKADEQVARERYEASSGRNRRSAEIRVDNLTDSIEELEEELENLNKALNTTTQASPSNVSFNTGASNGARVYNAALGTTMNTGARTMQAAFTPDFGQASLVRTSLGDQGSTNITQDMTGDQRKAYMLYGAFLNAGFSDSQSKALVGEVYRENSFQEQYWYGTHTDPANEATNAGIISWQGPRKTALYNYLGERGLLNRDGSMKRGYETLVAQAEFLRNEMSTGSAGGTQGQISRYQDWYRSDEVSPEESIRVLGGDFIRWRLNDPEFRSSGLANIQYGRSQIEGLELPRAGRSPDTMVADVPSGGDIEAGQSMLGTFSESIQSLGGFGFDALFGEGAFSQIIGSTNPEQMIASRLDSIFNRGGIATEAVELNRGSEAATQAAPIVVNAPQINNDNSVQGGGSGGGRERASQQVAIAPIGEQSATSTMRDWSDAIYS